jgi:hypothetical protein
VEAVGPVLDDADLVVQPLHPAVGETEADRCEDAVAVLTEGAPELDEGSEVRAARPGEPGAQVLGRGVRATAVEGAQLLLEQVRPVDAGVEAGDGGEPDALLGSEVLGCLEQRPARALQNGRLGGTLAFTGLGAPEFGRSRSLM